ncbi:unnamed protein product [Danaus chrysippus]|uniref:(African queen) hypothetical protein n=1 Tax=Danaus chrysippus TaxID=151541 RepID=A0A8J2QSZ0_9NEOP|nr:unnamed protein product [Danaus chrysippus]
MVIVLMKSVAYGPASHAIGGLLRNLYKNPDLEPPSKMFLTNQYGRPLYLFIEHAEQTRRLPRTSVTPARTDRHTEHSYHTAFNIEPLIVDNVCVY